MIYGGRWYEGAELGIASREMYLNHTHIVNSVAPMCRHPKLIKYYTDWQDVDEDSRTIINHGGHDTYGITAGAACRHMYDIHTNTYSYVASVQKNKQDLLTLW